MGGGERGDVSLPFSEEREGRGAWAFDWKYMEGEPQEEKK